MITTTMSELLKAREAFNTILQCKIPALSAMIAKKSLKVIVDEVSRFEEERNALIKKLGKADGKGNIGISKDDTEAMKAFNDEINPILEHSLTLNCDPIPIAVFEKADIAPAVLIDLEKFISE